MKGLWSSANAWLAVFLFASFFFSVVCKVRDSAGRKLNRGRKRNDREGDEGRGMSATQRQKFHTDKANQCLHNQSGSHGVPNINLSIFMCLMVDFGKVLCSSADELQQNSNASSIPQILTVLLEILRVYI